jgi:hypothetical protein
MIGFVLIMTLAAPACKRMEMKKAGRLSGLSIQREKFSDGSLSAGAECDASADFAHRLINQGEAAFAVSALVGLGFCQFDARVLQQSESRIHMRLLAESVADAHARGDKDADQHLIAGRSAAHLVLQNFEAIVARVASYVGNDCSDRDIQKIYVAKLAPLTFICRRRARG